MEARKRFLELCARLEVAEETAKSTVDTLLTLYGEPHRHYHNLRHVVSMLEHLDCVSSGNDPVELAIWFHDAVYDPKSHDNEAQSAALFMSCLGAQVDLKLAGKVIQLIMATDYSKPWNDEQDENLIHDIDLSILASPREIYLEYGRAIRKEYSHVSEDGFRAGRRAALAGFLERRIYQTASFTGAEAAARENICAELETLQDG
jgi:predicted metal-dependent HD superfamily phosphohydrolase